MKEIRTLPFLFLPFMFFFACSKQEDCPGTVARSVSVNMVSYSSDSLSRVYGLEGNGDILPTGYTKQQSLYRLYFNLSADGVAYIFRHGNQSDTLSFSYTRHQEFISDRCGCGMHCDITNIHASSGLHIESVNEDTSQLTINY